MNHISLLGENCSTLTQKLNICYIHTTSGVLSNRFECTFRHNSNIMYILLMADLSILINAI